MSQVLVDREVILHFGKLQDGLAQIASFSPSLYADSVQDIEGRHPLATSASEGEGGSGAGKAHEL